MKHLPHSTECEKSLLGCVIIDNTIFAKLDVSVEDFYHENHRKIFTAMQKLYSDGAPMEFASLATCIGKDYDAIGGIDTLTGLMDSAGGSANFGHYASIIKEKRQLRDIIALSATLNNKALDDPDKEGLITLLNNVQSQLTELTKSKSIVSGMLDDFVRDQVAHVEAVINGEIEDNAIKTGFPDLDRNIGGMRPGNLVVCAGRPGAGKTALALDFVLNAIRRGHCCAYYSLEMTCSEITRRLVAKVAGVGLKSLMNGLLSTDELARVREAMNKPYFSNLFISEENVMPSQVENFIDAWNMTHDQPLKVVVIDHLQLVGLRDGKAYERRDLQLARYTASLKDIAKRKQVCIVLLSQLNRSIDARTKGERVPKLSDLRDSGAIEQDADIVLGIYRSGLETLDQADQNTGLLLVLKNRNGQVGVIDLEWVGSRAMYRSIVREAPKPKPVIKKELPLPANPFEAPLKMVDQDTGCEIFLEKM